MRKITMESVGAFMDGRPYKKSNTVVNVQPTNVALFLHGNLIAMRDTLDNSIKISLCGWNTPTTRERLNGIPGVRISTRKGKAFLNGCRIEDNKFYTI